ncbi:10434_t:CDS:1, partial [Gigaspora margarita]
DFLREMFKEFKEKCDFEIEEITYESSKDKLNERDLKRGFWTNEE